MSVNHDDFAALAHGYALGTLTEDEARRFATHLQTCEECQRSVREMAVVGEALARALPPRCRHQLCANACSPRQRRRRSRLDQQPRDAPCGTGGSRLPRCSWPP